MAVAAARQRGRRRRRGSSGLALVGAAVAAAAATTASPARAQTTLAGGSLALKSAGSATLGGVGFVGTYLTVPAGGATVNFTLNATAGSAGAGTPHLQLVVADTAQGFATSATSATNYTTGNVFLPAGTYVVRGERDYAGNAGVSRSLTVNGLAVNTVSSAGGAAATFSNVSSNANALAAANTYIDHFRKTDATVTLSGPGGIPLLSGTPVHARLARHAFNFGTAVPGSSASGVNAYLGAGGSTQQATYQSHLNQNFNAVVPENAGKWASNEATRDAPNLGGVDAILNYAQSHRMRARMHNLIWGSQQPSYVGTMLANPNAPDADVAHGGTNAVGSTSISNKLGLYGATGAGGSAISEVSERINAYVGTGAPSDRARKYAELDVYNESYHTGEIAAGGNNYWSLYGPGGVAAIYNEVAGKVAGYPTPPKLYVNEYNVFQNSGDAYANWYANHLDKIRNAGGSVGGIGIQYYPSASIGSADNQHTPARIASVLQNLSVQGLPLSLNEFGVGTGGSQATAAQILDDTVRLMFGTPQATGFLMWGFQDEGTGNLFRPGAALYTVSNNFSTWTITEAGKRWQDLLGIRDWDGNPSNGWTTDQDLIADAAGTIHIAGGFFGDYYLSWQGPNTLGAQLLPFDLALS
jgi:GH35 family endo-1,4-beta-xylanase